MSKKRLSLSANARGAVKVSASSAARRRAIAKAKSDAAWDAWDKQIEDDSRAGRLDKLAERIDAQIAAGQTTSL